MMKLSENEKVIKKAIEEEDVYFLIRYYFAFMLTPLQTILVRWIAFDKYPRLSVIAMTRWGKSQCVVFGISLRILIEGGINVLFLGPQTEQAGILRDYMTEIILRCEELLEMTDFDTRGTESLKREFSKKKVTFKDGTFYKILSAHGEASGVMGFGVGRRGGVIIKDEATLIADKVNAKIMRMLGDNPDEASIIELSNPWERDNKAFEHFNDPDWKTFHVGWREAIKDGRTTQEFIDEMKKELTPIEFIVLYESLFPDESSDSIFRLSKIKTCTSQTLDIDTEKAIRVISADVADKGLDRTVIRWGYRHEGRHKIVDSYREPQSENVQVAGRIINCIKEFINDNKSNEEVHKLINEKKANKGLVNIDCIGVGTGVVSMVKEYVEINDLKNVEVQACHFGEGPNNKDRFLNKKAENYFRLKDITDDERINLDNTRQLIHELNIMKWEFTSSSKIRIVDPEKSPDEADSLVYFVWDNELGKVGLLTDNESIFG